jgi:hypothetical protein
MRRLGLLVAISLVACKPHPSSVHGKDYTIPVPKGYDLMTSAELPKEALALAYDDRRAGFRPSIVITPNPTMAIDAADAEHCAQVAKAMAAQTRTRVDGTAIVDGPTGKTCQMDVAGDKQSARGTIVKGSKSSWVVTCNHAPDDEATLEDCKAVLAGWKFDAP